MISSNQLAMELARRQKRIAFWRANFASATNNPKTLEKANELIGILSLLLSRLAAATVEEDFTETFQRMQATEQEIHNLYESSRLLTALGR